MITTPLVSIIVNNFNYEHFIADAINSVLQQTYKNYQLIVIDDGSTDASINIIKEFKDDRIEVIQKNNAGQLSCFNAAVSIVRGEYVFFLDSDDLWNKDYLKEVVKCYQQLNVDFIFTNYTRFGSIITKSVLPEEDILIEKSKFLTFLKKVWIGAPTSTLSMKTQLFKKILPLYDIEYEWKTRADDILIWATSLLDAKKFYFCKPLVQYRVHGNNNFHGRHLTQAQLEEREKAINIFFDKFSYIKKEATLQNIYNEYKKSNVPFIFYSSCFIRINFLWRILNKIYIIKHKDEKFNKIII